MQLYAREKEKARKHAMWLLAFLVVANLGIFGFVGLNFASYAIAGTTLLGIFGLLIPAYVAYGIKQSKI